MSGRAARGAAARPGGRGERTSTRGALGAGARWLAVSS